MRRISVFMRCIHPTDESECTRQFMYALQHRRVFNVNYSLGNEMAERTRVKTFVH